MKKDAKRKRDSCMKERECLQSKIITVQGKKEAESRKKYRQERENCSQVRLMTTFQALIDLFRVINLEKAITRIKKALL